MSVFFGKPAKCSSCESVRRVGSIHQRHLVLLLPTSRCIDRLQKGIVFRHSRETHRQQFWPAKIVVKLVSLHGPRVSACRNGRKWRRPRPFRPLSTTERGNGTAPPVCSTGRPTGDPGGYSTRPGAGFRAKAKKRTARARKARRCEHRSVVLPAERVNSAFCLDFLILEGFSPHRVSTTWIDCQGPDIRSREVFRGGGQSRILSAYFCDRSLPLNLPRQSGRHLKNPPFGGIPKKPGPSILHDLVAPHGV